MTPSWTRILFGLVLGLFGCHEQGTLQRDSPAGPGTSPAADDTADRAQERQDMVAQQIRHPRDGRRQVEDVRVLEAMTTVPRHNFVPEDMRPHAYLDRPLPIGQDQTISQPYIVALMSELLAVKPDHRILEIGTGSGYQAAVLAELTDEVYSIELLAPLAQQAKEALRSEGYDSIHLRTGDGFQGWPEAAPFDSIILTCAIDEIPPPLWEQLRTGGRLVMPLGPREGMQRLIVATKREDGSQETRTITGVRFVPLISDSASP